MLHLIQKLDRGRWKTVAIATDSGTGHDRLDRAVGMAPAARFRLIAMVDGGEQLVRQVDPRLRDLLPNDPVPPAVVSALPPQHQPRPAPTLPRTGFPPPPPNDPFIPPLAEIPLASPPLAPVRRPALNPLRLALQLGGAIILLAVLIDNIGTVSDRMRIAADTPATEVPPAPPDPQPIPPLLAPPVLAGPDIADPPSLMVADRPSIAVVEDPPAPAPEPPQVQAIEPLAPIAPPPSLSIADCRALAQTQARFGSRINPAAPVDAGPDRVEGADLQFQTLFGDWRTIQYRCHATPLGGVLLSEIRLH